MSLTSFMVRTMFKRGDDKRDAGCTTPEDVRRFDDIVYGLNPRWNRLDVYRPKDAEGLLLEKNKPDSALKSLGIHKGFLRPFALNPACACEIVVIFFVFRYTSYICILGVGTHGTS